MKYSKIIIIAFLLKVLYNFFIWIYGYFLRIKWASFYNSNNKSAIGYTYQIRVYLSNYPSYERINDIFPNQPQQILNLFIESHGYYRHLFLQNFNPFYWIKMVIYLPQNILYYLGFKPKRKSLHLINFIWWLCSIIFAIYNDEITAYIKTLINSLFKTINK